MYTCQTLHPFVRPTGWTMTTGCAWPGDLSYARSPWNYTRSSWRASSEHGRPEDGIETSAPYTRSQEVGHRQTRKGNPTMVQSGNALSRGSRLSTNGRSMRRFGTIIRHSVIGVYKTTIRARVRPDTMTCRAMTGKKRSWFTSYARSELCCSGLALLLKYNAGRRIREQVDDPVE